MAATTTTQVPKMRRRVEEDIIIRELSEEERLQNAMNSTDDEDNEPEEDDGVPFTMKMRQATRKVHNISDALVNAKLGIAMSDEKVWAEGLLVFYEIFRFLENALERLAPRNSHFKKMNAVMQDIQRTKAFEEDLQYYYGNNYLKTYQIRPSVADYLKHLKTLEEREPLRLLAYVYHLYMGLLSGGQILKRKRELRRKLKRSFGELLGWFGLRPQGSTANSHGSSSSSKPGNSVIWLVALVAIGSFCMYWFFRETLPALPISPPPPADSLDLLDPVDTQFEIGADGFLQ